MEIKCLCCRHYTHPQVFFQQADDFFLGMNVSGVERMEFLAPDKTFAGKADNSCLWLVPAGFFIDFSFDSRRENYAFRCTFEGISWNPVNRKIEISLDGHLLEIPPAIPVPPGRKEMLQDIFRRCTELCRTAIPGNMEICKLLMMSVIAEFAEYSRHSVEEKVPRVLLKLKKAIESDTDFSLTLAEIMADFDMTPYHLRRLFLRFYRTTPAEYRAGLRFARIQELMQMPDMNFKELASAVGMNHVSHLHLFIKKRCGMTPSQLRRSLLM